eukprot:3934372-Rhodomonas_salina.7
MGERDPTPDRPARKRAIEATELLHGLASDGGDKDGHLGTLSDLAALDAEEVRQNNTSTTAAIWKRDQENSPSTQQTKHHTPHLGPDSRLRGVFFPFFHESNIPPMA